MKVTLNDIAKKIGVSPSTVQRALNGVQGVGDEKRDVILRLAEEMGYRRNPIAFSLKSGVKTIVIALPEPMHNNRYYVRYLWEGAMAGGRAYSEFNLRLIQESYTWTPENHAAKLREILDALGDELDGVLTMGTADAETGIVLASLKERGIPVVFVGTDSSPTDRLCCVRTYDEMAGRMAADLLINFTFPEKHSKVIMTGDFAIVDQFYNAQGFERHILENESPLEIFKLSNDPDLEVVKEGIAKVLQSGLDVCAVYATSARNTVPMCRAIAECGLTGKVRSIGSDIFPESIEMMRANQLNAIIHKRPIPIG